MEALREKIELIMQDDQKRKVVLLVAALLILTILVFVMFDEPEKKTVRIKNKAQVNHSMLAPDDIADLDQDRVDALLDNYKKDLDAREKEMNLTERKTERELQRFNKEQEGLRDTIKKLVRENENLKNSVGDLSERTSVITEDPNLKSYLQEARKQSQMNQASIAFGASAGPTGTLASSTAGRLQAGSGMNNSEKSEPIQLGIRSVSGNDSIRHTGVIPANETEEQRDVRIERTQRRLTATAEKERIEKEKEEQFFLPAGSILSGTLLTGMDAPTGGNAKSEPWPALLRIKMEAILPNRWSLDIRECFLLAGAYGDLSSHRAYMRSETLSCVREDGRAIEVSIDAFGTGADGKAGIRGRVVTKNGQLLGQSLLAGFVGGLAEATKPQAIPTINTRPNANGQTSFVEPYIGDVMTSAAYNGASSAAEKIADYLLKVAENIFPIIEIDAGRQMDFVLQRGVMLKIR